MSAITSIPSTTIRGLHLRPRLRPYASLASPSGSLQSVIMKNGASRREQLGRSRRRRRSQLRVVMDGSVLPGSSPPPPPNFPVWVTWVLGSIVTILVPILKLKGGFLLNLGKRLDQVVETVEDLAEVVEDVAEAVENAASEVADHLPQGEIKDAALWIENASKEVGEEAEQAKDFMNKVGNFTDEVDKKVETILDSITEETGEAVQNQPKLEAPNDEVEDQSQTRGREQNDAGEANVR